MAHLLTLALAAFGTGLLFAQALRGDPAPAPEPEPERDPDYCFTHDKIEREDER